MSNFNQDKNEMKNKASDVYESGKKHVSDKAGSIEDTVKDAAYNLYDEGKKHCKTAEKYVGEATQEIIKSIKDKPLTSVLMAGAVGWVLSVLLKK